MKTILKTNLLLFILGTMLFASCAPHRGGHGHKHHGIKTEMGGYL